MSFARHTGSPSRLPRLRGLNRCKLADTCFIGGQPENMNPPRAGIEASSLILYPLFPRSLPLPRTLNAEDGQLGRFRFLEVVLDQVVNPAAARPPAEAAAKFVQVLGITGGNHFHVAILGVAHPAAQPELIGLALHKPAESHSLDAPADEKVKHHG